MTSYFLSLVYRHLRWIGPFLFYAIASGVLFAGGIGRGLLFQPYGDSPTYVWFLNWWCFALINHINPFVSFYVWSPVGFNMMWAASVPTLALLVAPITWKFGPIASWNLLCISAPAINSFAAYILLRYITRDRGASFAGGYLFGFSSYVLSQLLQHLNLLFVPFIPLFVLLGLRRLNRDIGRIAYIALMSLAAALQFGISTEVLATSAFFGLLAYLTFYLRFRNTLDMRGLAMDTAISGLVAIIVLAPAIYYLISGYEQVPDVINSARAYSADLLNFVVPTPTTRIGGPAFEGIARKFTGNYAEEGAYIGIPLLLALGFAVNAQKSRKWLPPAIIVLAATMLLSLGPWLWIGGEKTDIPLPWQLLMHVPLLTHALPTRFPVYTALIISMLISLWLSTPSLSPVVRRTRYGMAIMAALFLAPNTMLYAFGKIETPALFMQKELAAAIGINKTLVVLPYGYLGNSMYWQLSSNMSFRMAGGYVGFAPKYFAGFPATSYFYGRNLPSDFEYFNKAIYAFCLVQGVDAILITPKTSPDLTARLERLPWQRSREGSIVVLKVPKRQNVQ